LLNAKTAFVENRSAKDKDFEKFCKELKKWGRFTPVQDRRNADILISVDATKGQGRSGLMLYPFEANTINIEDRFGVLLYTDMTEEGFKNPENLVSTLKHKMKQK